MVFITIVRSAHSATWLDTAESAEAVNWDEVGETDND